MAGRRSSSYTVANPSRQPSAERLPRVSRGAAVLARGGRMVAIVGLAAALSGCAGIMMPLSSWMSGAPQAPAEDATGSIGRAPAAPAAPDTDAEAIRRAIEVAVARGAEAPVAWKNDATGHSGTLTNLAAVRASNGAPCRDFETTLVTVQGVDLHGGRACQGYWGTWELLKFDRVGG